mmetsp:Transcript_53168/g.164777  ORF Transcript_53168/g.164777 Transcript_53168/m.164777 type:complete len:230 (-) Transcript_53168:272-961(-)
MGIPLEVAPSPHGQQPSAAEFLEAPLRLQAESYETFAAQLHIGQDTAEHRTVDEELRELQIDPEVFYRDARRLGVHRFSPDELDPAGAPPPQLPEAAGAGVDATASGWAFKPPGRDLPPSDGEDEAPAPAPAAPPPGLNVPDHDDIEDIPYDEVALDGETRGGRMGRETPRGLSAKLQIDSLTDDEDEEPRGRAAAAEVGSGNEDDEVEAFTLDPDFDYDKVDNLTRRV